MTSSGLSLRQPNLGDTELVDELPLERLDVVIGEEEHLLGMQHRHARPQRDELRDRPGDASGSPTRPCPSTSVRPPRGDVCRFAGNVAELTFVVTLEIALFMLGALATGALGAGFRPSTSVWLSRLVRGDSGNRAVHAPCPSTSVRPPQYLADVLPRLARRVRLRDIGDLMPTRWRAKNATEASPADQN